MGARGPEMSHIDASQLDSPFGSAHSERYFAQLRRRLRWQLLAAYASPLLLLSLVLHYQHSDAVRQGIDTHLRSVAEHKRNTVSLFLQERIANTRQLLRFDAALIPSAAEMQHRLARLQQESDAFVDIGLFDRSGRLVAYAGPHPELLGKDYGQERWFRQLHGGGRAYHISDVFMGFRGCPHFIVAVKRMVQGDPWTLRASVDPERFGRFVNSSLLLKRVEAFIVNSRGARQTVSGAVDRFRPPQHRPGEARVSRHETRGEEYLAAFSWLEEVDWALVVRVPAAIAYAGVRSSRLSLAGLLLATVILLVFLVGRSTRRIVDRLRSTDRARDELQRQLFNAAKLASVGEMGAGVAHEINNPLAIIYEEAGMLKDILDPSFGEELDLDELRDRLGAITEATLRGRAITRKLLAFSREYDPKPELIDVNGVLERTIEIKAHELKVSDVELIEELLTDLPPVLFAANELEQVLLNLLNNAKDAIEGRGQIVVRTSEERGWVRVDVADTGCGMSEEQLEKIFFPFFTTKGVGKGTGLGLSISYGIVKAHGGRIEVESEPGGGSTFSVLLPGARRCDAREVA